MSYLIVTMFENGVLEWPVSGRKDTLTAVEWLRNQGMSYQDIAQHVNIPLNIFGYWRRQITPRLAEQRQIEYVLNNAYAQIFFDEMKRADGLSRSLVRARDGSDPDREVFVGAVNI